MKYFNIPIFNQTVYVSKLKNFDKVISEFERLLAIDEIVDAEGGIAFHVNNGSVHGMWFDMQSVSDGIISHEAMHCVRAIFRHIGCKEVIDEEIEAYLLTYVVDEIWKILKPSRKSDK